MARYYKTAFVAGFILFCALYSPESAREGKSVSPSGKQTRRTEQAQPVSTDATPPLADATVQSATLSQSATSSISATTDAQDQNELFAAFSRAMDRQNGVDQPAQSTQPETLITDEKSPLQYLGQTLMSLGFVIFLLLICAWVGKRFVGKTHSFGGGYIEVLGSYALSQKSKVHLVRVGDEHFLLGEGAGSVSLISRIDLESSLQRNTPLTDAYDEDPKPLTSFSERLSEWQNSLENRDLNQQVNASVLLLAGLAKRLKRKGAESDG
ncbi:MAG: flagellar biosynthetic protein FliO [bacterium]|jgi:flagellar biosynthetic protein FliO